MRTVLEPATTPANYRRTIPRATARSPHTARQWAHTLIAGLGLDPYTVDLAVSELTTNVVRYAPGPAAIALTVTREAIEVTVTDRHPETRGNVQVGDETGDCDAVSGRCLYILAALALDGVHVDTDPRRKHVAVRLPIGETS